MSSAPEIIRVRGLRKVYRVGEVDVEALRGIDLDVMRGEFVAIVGPSGSGKSTLFHILGGLAPPTAGEVWIDGVDLRKMGESERTEMRQRKVGFVFQKYNLLPTLTARDNIGLAQAIAGIKSHRPDSTMSLIYLELPSGSIINRALYPAASNNASRLPALW